MNKHEQALQYMINLSKRIKIEIKDCNIIAYVNDKTSEHDFNLLKSSVKDLGAIQFQKLIKILG